MRNANQKTTSLGLRGDEMGWKIRDPEEAHLAHLLKVHTKFQFLSSIWKEDKGGTALLWGQKWRNPHISLPN